MHIHTYIAYIFTYIHTYIRTCTYVLLCLKTPQEDLIGQFLNNQIEEHDIEWLKKYSSEVERRCTFNNLNIVVSLASDIFVNDKSFLGIFPGMKSFDIGGKTETTRGWIGDEVVNAVCHLIMKEHKKFRDEGLQRAKFFIAGTALLTHMIDRDVEAVSRWYKMLNVDDEEFIFIPHNAFKCHWALVIIDTRNSPIISIDYLDHLYEGDERDEVERVLNLAMDWYKTRTTKTDLTF